MRVRKWVSAGVCVALATLGLSACSDTDESAGSNNSGGNGSAAPAGEAINIGAICSCTGLQAAAFGKADIGIRAWVDHINDQGGLNGHPVNLFVKDDGGDPAKGLQAAKELIEKNKVIAIVGMTSVTDQAWASYVDEKKIPVVGGLTPVKSFATDPNFFPSGANSIVATFGTMQEAKKVGATKIGFMYCAETPTCSEVDLIGTPFAQLLGLGYESLKISATQPNYTAQCLTFKQDGVDAVFIVHNSSVGVRVAADCTKAGYKPKLQIGQMNTIGLDSLASPDFDGAILSGSNALYMNDSIPAVKEYLDAAEAWKPGITEDPQFNTLTFYGWAGGKLLEAVAKVADLSPTSTSAAVYQGLYALKDETLGELSPPLTFAKSQPAFPACYFANQVEDGKVVALDGGKPVCLTAEQLSAMQPLLAALAG